jgi:hypothetical protein
VAALGFVVALLLKQVPLRELEETAAADMGEGFAMPSAESSDRLLEVAVARLLRNTPDIRLRVVAAGPGCELDVAALWALLQIYRHNQVHGSAELTRIAEHRHVPPEVLEPTFARIVDGGYALRAGDRLWLTQAGLRQVEAVIAALVGRIVDRLAASPSFEGRPDRAEVEAALERIAHRMVLQRDWYDDEARPNTAPAG